MENSTEHAARRTALGLQGIWVKEREKTIKIAIFDFFIFSS
jgi:hypothetical protein